MPAPPANAPKELRFTRSRQALVMLLVGLSFLLASVGVFVLNRQRITQPPSLWWLVLTLPPALGFFWLAWKHSRHAFLVVSRLGIEIYPFFLPQRRMQLVTWQEMSGASVSEDHAWLIITLANYKDSKIIVTLAPIPWRSRPLLSQAVDRVMEFKQKHEAAAKTVPAGGDEGALVFGEAKP